MQHSERGSGWTGHDQARLALTAFDLSSGVGGWVGSLIFGFLLEISVQGA